MAKRATSATVFTCDGCGKESIMEEHDEPPYGFHMQVIHISSAGGDGADDVYACSWKCIQAAVRAGLTRDDRE